MCVTFVSCVERWTFIICFRTFLVDLPLGNQSGECCNHFIPVHARITRAYSHMLQDNKSSIFFCSYKHRDTFLHFGKTWENIQVYNKIEMGGLVRSEEESLYKLTAFSIPEDSNARMHQPAIPLHFRFNR